MKYTKGNTIIFVIGGIILAILIIFGAVYFKGNGGQPVDAGYLLDANDPTALVIGNKNASTTIFVFSDFQCPYCKQLHEEGMAQVRENYVKTGKVKIIMRDKAFIGPESVLAAQAARCANEQGKFEQMADAIFKNQNGENQGNYIKDNLKKLAKEINLDETKFNQCLDSDKYAAQITAEKNASFKLDGPGTPIIHIGNQKFVGVRPYDILKTAIDQELNKK